MKALVLIRVVVVSLTFIAIPPQQCLAVDKADGDPRSIALVQKAAIDYHKGKYAQGLITAEKALKLYLASR
ncbi:MAG: hypothetical protein K2W95_19855 [Candidatus Obscuribacterales bacterium]|nr:hypothetical protein [Candidatus Obscuribacterales bacterium]